MSEWARVKEGVWEKPEGSQILRVTDISDGTVVEVFSEAPGRRRLRSRVHIQGHLTYPPAADER